MTNTKLLYETINERGLKIKKVADAAGLSYHGFRRKATNETEFTAREITAVCEAVRIDKGLRDKIFFAQFVA